MNIVNNKYSSTIALIDAIEAVRLELKVGELRGDSIVEQNEVYTRLLYLYSLLMTQDIKELIQRAA